MQSLQEYIAQIVALKDKVAALEETNRRLNLRIVELEEELEVIRANRY